jgi:hypothetical protein
MKLRSLLVASASIAILALTVYAAEEIKLEGIKCVMNPKANAKLAKALDYKDGKIFFCCDNCPKAFAKKVKDDEKVAANGNRQLIATGQAKQAKCPFTGGPAKAETAIKVSGAEISFCCNNCKGKAEKLKGDEQLIALFGDKAYTKAVFKVKKEE